MNTAFTVPAMGKADYATAQRVGTIAGLRNTPDLIESITMLTPNPNADDEQIIAATQKWLEKAVIGLNLCPFAKAVHVKKQVRYVVSNASTPEALLECEVVYGRG